jgi:hypothetical protein
MANYVYSQLSEDLYRIPKAQILVGVWENGVKPDRLFNLGDYEDINLAYEVEETEIVGNDSKVQTVRKTIVTKTGGTLTFSARQISDIVRELMYMSEKRTVAQDANAAFSKAFKNLKVGDIIETDILNPAVATLGQGVGEDAVEFVKGTHFHVTTTGRVEILALPVGYVPATDADLDVAGPAAALSTTEYGILRASSKTLRIVIEQVNDNGDDIVIPKIQIRPDGDLSLGGSGTDPVAVSFTGKIQEDITEEDGRRLGYARAVPVAA